jgi:hypothetical protein
VAGGWWLVAGGWWLVAGGWWLVAGGWWLVKYITQFGGARGGVLYWRGGNFFLFKNEANSLGASWPS